MNLLRIVSRAPSRLLTDRASAGIADVLAGRRHDFRSFLLFVGPAVVASVAYVDPGNFATNIQAGARYGYALLWVALAANVIAMLFQALSAKLGIATGRNLAELCRDHCPRALAVAMWIVSEIAAMATDLAEFLGAALGLALLLHVPLLVGMLMTAVVTFGVLMADQGGFRLTEIVVGAMVALISLCYVAEVFVAPVDWAAAGRALVAPSIPDAAALTIAVGIIGATVMPHALYLHSGLTQGRGSATDDRQRRLLVRYSNREVVAALSVAGLVNMAMITMAASAFHAGHADVAEIETAYHTLTPLLGGAAAAIFLVSLIASGLSSSVVGTLAGQMIMQGFVGFRIPVWVRRVVTMAPAFAVVLLGIDVTRALVMSQVVLSIALPVPMLAILWLTRRRDLMGGLANGRLTSAAAAVGAAVVLILNVVLLLQTFGVPIPGLPAA